MAPLKVIPPAEIAKLGSIHFPSFLMKVLNLQLLTGCSSCDEDLADDYDYNWGGEDWYLPKFLMSLSLIGKNV